MVFLSSSRSPIGKIFRVRTVFDSYLGENRTVCTLVGGFLGEVTNNPRPVK